jgi:hypothetical protein
MKTSTGMPGISLAEPRFHGGTRIAFEFSDVDNSAVNSGGAKSTAGRERSGIVDHAAPGVKRSAAKWGSGLCQQDTGLISIRLWRNRADSPARTEPLYEIIRIPKDVCVGRATHRYHLRFTAREPLIAGMAI